MPFCQVSNFCRGGKTPAFLTVKGPYFCSRSLGRKMTIRDIIRVIGSNIAPGEFRCHCFSTLENNYLSYLIYRYYQVFYSILDIKSNPCGRYFAKFWQNVRLNAVIGNDRWWNNVERNTSARNLGSFYPIAGGRDEFFPVLGGVTRKYLFLGTYVTNPLVKGVLFGASLTITYRGSCSPVPWSDCSCDLPGDGIIDSLPIVERFLRTNSTVGINFRRWDGIALNINT